MRTIDLSGPEGNAFVLLGYARRWSRQLGLDASKVHGEMTAGNYENLIRVFEHYFGTVAELINKPGDSNEDMDEE